MKTMLPCRKSFNLRASVNQLCRLIFIISLTLFSSSVHLGLAYQEEPARQVHLDQFDMLTDSSGWVLLDRQLFWTSDVGQTWTEVSPSIPADASVEDVQFINSNIGWVLITLPNPDDSALFQLAQTDDGGLTWGMRPLSLFESGDVASYAEKAEMGWLDAQNGWISVKQSSGSNFSLGTLFKTSDGGNSWSRLSLPVADIIFFSDSNTGWAVGGPSNDQLFKTQDAGATWRDMRPAEIPADIQTIIYPPVTSGGQDLLVTTNEGFENTLNVYSLKNSPENWSFADQVKLDVQSGIIGISMLDAQNFVAVIPGTKSIVRMINSHLDLLENIDGASASIVELDMLSLDVGWAKSVESSCATFALDDETASVSCSSTTRLLQTKDGGATWQNVELPMVAANRAFSAAPSQTKTITTSAVASGENTMAVIGQGFDRCQIPTILQMQVWSQNSPYRSVNLYIGGVNRACSNNALNSSYIFQLYQQGWKFFPTWVGPQAPCTSYLNRFSLDVSTAFQQGVDQANLAVERLAELALTGPTKTGSVVYYDMENYGTGTSCRAAVNAFMNGWVSQIHARGNLAGVYGSTLCDTGLSDFQNITNVPDVIWPARWYHNFGEGFYDPNASVWNLGSCLPNTAWSNHQRIRQYEGDHDETWGGLTLDIDSNVLDGVVTIPYNYPFVSRIVRADSNPTDASSVDFTINFSKSVTGVNVADLALMTTGSISGAPITNMTGSGNAYTVTVNTGSGTGTIRLDLVDDDSIRDGSNNSLGGTGIGNGNFTSGERYTLTEPSNVDVYIGGELRNSHYVASEQNASARYGINGGPVHVVSKDGVTPIFASERAIFGNSFNSIIGYPANQLTTDYWFTSYDDAGMITYLVIGNPHPSQTAEVDVFIAGNLMGHYSIAPGQRVFPRYGINAGPVRVVSTNGMNIFTSERTKFGNSFNEVMGYPANQLTTEYWFTSYDDAGMITYLIVGNPHSSQTAEVDVYIAGTLRGHYSIAPGERVFPRYGINSGPVRVVSTNGVNIFASERTKFGNTFNEVMGYPGDQVHTEFWFTSYDDTSMITYLVVGNPHPSQTAQVDVYIGDVKKNATPYSIAPGQRIFQRYGINSGPLHVVSTNGVDVFASERSKYLQSFNEILGIAGNQLTTDYWFTSYDDLGMTTYLVIASP